jgi:excisionase family DNA binding protein
MNQGIIKSIMKIRPRKLYTIAEISSITGMNKPAITMRIRRNNIPHTAIGGTWYIAGSEILKWVKIKK